MAKISTWAVAHVVTSALEAVAFVHTFLCLLRGIGMGIIVALFIALSRHVLPLCGSTVLSETFVRDSVLSVVWHLKRDSAIIISKHVLRKKFFWNI
jgi:hypothetical protein